VLDVATGRGASGAILFVLLNEATQLYAQAIMYNANAHRFMRPNFIVDGLGRGALTITHFHPQCDFANSNKLEDIKIWPTAPPAQVCQLPDGHKYEKGYVRLPLLTMTQLSELPLRWSKIRTDVVTAIITQYCIAEVFGGGRWRNGCGKTVSFGTGWRYTLISRAIHC